jgi:NAD(P)-dependent dehydrogenase (short-subunit alcohol dehydrogenase family)
VASDDRGGGAGEKQDRVGDFLRRRQPPHRGHRDRHGGIDVLVNGAGISLRHPALDHPLADWEEVVAVNMTGVFLCARAAARHMRARNNGAIVNIASTMGFSGGGVYPNVSYLATKGAVVNMTRAVLININ